ncbi:Snurportin-1 [Thalictrum thalictroides]|uniref:Snurportin-1 n=1 Tax=Thalictrum thalictroides TaxID=46969 RepID=A0A7J6VV03_THATH|nr:Snurportin-1 [Thalictrum thalictroides]
MAPHDLRRPFKRAAISDQQKRRELALLRQEQSRRDSQNHARTLASSVLSLQNEPPSELKSEPESPYEPVPETVCRDFDVVRASKLKGSEARQWFSRQLMLPEWMIDIPPRLNQDWYVFARPSGKRCFVVSSDGTTVSRLRNGYVLHHFPSSLPNGARTKDNSGPSNSYVFARPSGKRCFVVSSDGTTVSRLRNGYVLHHFPSSLPNGARTKDNSGPSNSFSLLDCIFHEPDQTYYVIDMVCWRGYSLSDCTAEFRFFWLNDKLAETGACNPPSSYHRYKFSVVPIYSCDLLGLHTAYNGHVPYVKDGLLFYNKHAHYQTGNTPLALVWKDETCSQYVLDTDSKGEVPAQQQIGIKMFSSSQHSIGVW